MAKRLAATVLGICLSLPIAEAANITGAVSRIRDGDGFFIGATEIRLCGIDAPEKGDVGYQKSARDLEAVTAGKTVRCVPVGQGTVCDGRSPPTSYRRIVAQCFVDDRDIADLLVERGAACDWTLFSGGHYSRNGGSRCP